MKTRIVSALLAAGLLAAPAAFPQPEPAKAVAAKRLTRIFEVKHADVDRVAKILQFFGAVKSDASLRIIAVEASAETMSAIEEMLKKLDVPAAAQKNVELTFHILHATPEPAVGKLPAEMEPVTRQLRTVFSYQGFRLLETLSLRVRNSFGGAMVGHAPGPEASVKIRFHVEFRAVHVAMSEKTPVVRIDGLNFSLRSPFAVTNPATTNITQYQFLESQIRTDVDVREGQKVVVGKANMQGSEGAVVLVLTAKVVD